MSFCSLAVLIPGFLPPVLERLSLHDAAHILRNIYSYICHGIPERCPVILGQPAALCARCTGIYLAFFIGCFFLFPWTRHRVSYRTAVISALLFTCFMIVHWILEYARVLTSSIFLQAATGLMWGLGTSVFLCVSIDRLRKNRQGHFSMQK
jgi:uncharacterized membrane protein